MTTLFQKFERSSHSGSQLSFKVNSCDIDIYVSLPIGVGRDRGQIIICLRTRFMGGGGEYGEKIAFFG